MLVLVDFGSQTTHLIRRRLADAEVACELIAPRELESYLSHPTVAGFILSGGPQSVYEDGALLPPLSLFSLGVPVLGICYGWQAMAYQLGGQVCPTGEEYGVESVRFHAPLFEMPCGDYQVVMSHGDTVVDLPPGFVSLASSQRIAYAAAGDPVRRLYGLQFHPEASHSSQGEEMLLSFAQRICGMASVSRGAVRAFDVEKIVEAIQKQVGSEGEILAAVSGGVDSSVAAHLMALAVGKRFHPVYVESGLMREGTAKRVRSLFGEEQVVVIDARARFLHELEGVTDPEMKRTICGRLYIEIFTEAAERYWPAAQFLGQGTIFSDWVESSGGKRSAVIKTHHNVGGIPTTCAFSLVEPLRELYKDEVRALGRQLGLPTTLLEQEPFPGPGYSVRMVGEVTNQRLLQLQKADRILAEELQNEPSANRLFQCFAILTGSYSTAVVGDQRAFGEVIALRAYHSSDVMTAEIAELPYPWLRRLARRITSEVEGISRVVYDITDKPPATMEWM